PVTGTNLRVNDHAPGSASYVIDGASGPKGNQFLHNTVDMASDARWALLFNDATGPCLARNNILYNRNPYHGGITCGSASDVSALDSDFNIMDRVTPNDAGTVYTLAQWQALGHEPHSFSASLASLFVSPGSDYHLLATAPAVNHGQ